MPIIRCSIVTFIDSWCVIRTAIPFKPSKQIQWRIFCERIFFLPFLKPILIIFSPEEASIVFEPTRNSHKFAPRKEPWCLFSLLFVIFKYSSGVVFLRILSAAKVYTNHGAHCTRINYLRIINNERE